MPAHLARAHDGPLTQFPEIIMAKKPAAKSEFVLFNVVYEDGTQRSNRRVPADILGGLDKDEPAKAFIEAQDADIAEKSGMPLGPIKTIKRSGK